MNTIIRALGALIAVALAHSNTTAPISAELAKTWRWR
jgi:hypothetical protein